MSDERFYELVYEAPAKCKKNEFIVFKPNFLEYVKKGKVNDSGVTTLGRLRNIFIEIGNDYNEKFSAYTHVNLSNFIGIEYKDEKELSNIVYKIVEQQVPEIISKSIEDQLKKMPSSVNFIWYVSNDLKYTSIFGKFNIRMNIKNKKESSETTN